MKHKVESLAAKLTSILSSWPGVDCVLSCEAAETDVLDPYFALVLDVYCDGPIPDERERAAAFGEPGAFETSLRNDKDRFFLDSLPIRIEYKDKANLSRMIEHRVDQVWVFGTSGTYMVHRLVFGKILYRKSGWIDSMLSALSDNPPEFWSILRETFQFRMEHCLSDLGGAALNDDRFFYFVSLAGFMHACASALFAFNHQWEPSDRHLTEALMALPRLPDDFEGRWSGLMRTDGVDPERRYQIAQLIARSVFALA